MAHAALKVIRPVVRLSSALAPRPVGRLAFRLFCTPIGHAPVKPSSPSIERARTLFARGERNIVPYGCGYAQVVWFEPEQAARGSVLVLHGWTGQGLFMAGFVEPLLAQGFRVAVMDLPAHGGSSGRHLTFPIAIEAASAVVRDHLPLAGIVAHSFGGAVAMAAIAGGVATLQPIPARRLVTIAAPMGMSHHGKHFADMLGLTRNGHAAFEDEVLAITGRPMASFSGGDYLAASRVRTLLIHAPDDKEIPFAEAEEMARAGDHVTLQAMPGLGHRRILMARPVHEAAAAFIAAR
jgi:pimeloyl-ACP methyl ester carboxylesterase